MTDLTRSRGAGAANCGRSNLIRLVVVLALSCLSFVGEGQEKTGDAKPDLNDFRAKAEKGDGEAHVIRLAAATKVETNALPTGLVLIKAAAEVKAEAEVAAVAEASPTVAVLEIARRLQRNGVGWVLNEQDREKLSTTVTNQWQRKVCASPTVRELAPHGLFLHHESGAFWCGWTQLPAETRDKYQAIVAEAQRNSRSARVVTDVSAPGVGETSGGNSGIRQSSAYPMQKYVYDQQLSAKRYMKTVADGEVEQIALREYPNDYSMQKYVYDQQLSAKRYMKTVADGEVERIALREYPNDYSMQKYVYDNQLSAKHHMNAASNPRAKSQAQREYPNDYSMQKYIYDRALNGN